MSTSTSPEYPPETECVSCGHSYAQHGKPHCWCDRASPSENGCLAHNTQRPFYPCQRKTCTCARFTTQDNDVVTNWRPANL